MVKFLPCAAGVITAFTAQPKLDSNTLFRQSISGAGGGRRDGWRANQQGLEQAQSARAYCRWGFPRATMALSRKNRCPPGRMSCPERGSLDVIGSGREPERDPRPPLPRRWRLAALALAVVAAGLAVTGVELHHAAGSRGPAPPAGASPASVAPPAVPAPAPVAVPVPVQALVPLPPLPSPLSGPSLAHAQGVLTIACAPSTGACSVRLYVAGQAVSGNPAGR